VLQASLPPRRGTFIGPDGDPRDGASSEMPREIFGPVLHVATFRAADLDRVIAVNARATG
jgi:RHH-type transcriptional regulator, proline utilization regulon repressor / proline dehydrogenase / delta 1-pyrroline-5-carboxylate dehydrogenase